MGAELVTTQPSTICHPVLLVHGLATTWDPQHQWGGEAALLELVQTPTAAPRAQGRGGAQRGAAAGPQAHPCTPLARQRLHKQLPGLGAAQGKG